MGRMEIRTGDSGAMGPLILYCREGAIEGFCLMDVDGC